MCHELKDVDESDEDNHIFTDRLRTSSPEPTSDDDKPADITGDSSTYENRFNRPGKRKRHRVLPVSGLRDMEAMLHMHNSHSGFSRLLDTEDLVRPSVWPLDSRFLLHYFSFRNLQRAKKKLSMRSPSRLSRRCVLWKHFLHSLCNSHKRERE